MYDAEFPRSNLSLQADNDGAVHDEEEDDDTVLRHVPPAPSTQHSHVTASNNTTQGSHD